MSEQPLLTLCIPTFNRAPFLDILLSKIEKQTGEFVNIRFLELIVSDNCSNDNTSQIVHKYLNK